MPMRLVRKYCVGAIRAGLDFETLLRESCINLDPDDPRDEIPRSQHVALILNVNLSLGVEAHVDRCARLVPLLQSQGDHLVAGVAL